MRPSIISIIYAATVIVGAFVLVVNPEVLLHQNFFLASVITTTLLVLYFMRQNIGTMKTLLILLIALIIGYIVEYLGVHQGAAFSPYEYTSFLGPQIFGIPILIPFSWFVATTTAWLIARLVIGFHKRTSPLLLTVTASLFAVVYDLPIEYMAMHVWKSWEWAASGPLLGVPSMNYVGWFMVAFLIFGLAAGAWRSINKTGRGYRDLQLICFSSFAMILFHLTLVLIN